MISRFTRRALGAWIGKAVTTAAAGAVVPPTKSSGPKQLPRVGEFVRFLDGTTETPVVRLTALTSSNSLPAAENRAISVKGRFLVFSSDRSGAASPFRLDLRSGQVSQLLATKDLDVSSLTLDTAARLLLFREGRDLKQLAIGSKKVQTLAENVGQFSLGGSPSDFLFIREQKVWKGPEQRLIAEDADWCQVRPGDQGSIFSRPAGEDTHELWFCDLRQAAKPIRLAAAPVSMPCWSNDGRSVFFLRNRSLYEVVPETGSEQKLGGMSQFVSFSANADGSVFVGAVQSKAQPTINLLLRSPAREFTLCEHRASQPQLCAPVFSADSKRVYFNSDFQGKPAIYSVNVEALIEETAG